MQLPSIQNAHAILNEAETMNPGPWADHSRYVGQAARNVAEHHAGLDPDRASVFGLLHDIGRRNGFSHLKHAIDGYRYMIELGYPAVARICLTHSFPLKNVDAYDGTCDCGPDDLAMVGQYLDDIEFDDYDHLIQLCDGMCLPTGFSLLEKRLMDVALRHGVTDFSVRKWKAALAIQDRFEEAVGRSIYELLPGVLRTTFGTENVS